MFLFDVGLEIGIHAVVNSSQKKKKKRKANCLLVPESVNTKGHGG